MNGCVYCLMALFTSTRRYYDPTSLLVRWFVCLFIRYGCCDLSKCTSLIFMKFGTDVRDDENYKVRNC